MRIVLRDAAESDAPAVARIYVDSWNAGFGSLMPTRELNGAEVDRWRRDLTDEAVHWRVATRRGLVWGFAGSRPSREPPDPDLAELDTMAVDPAYWRAGVGRLLMTDAVDALRVAGFSSAHLWTLANYPAGAAFYRAMGWTPDGRTRDSGRQISYRIFWG